MELETPTALAAAVAAAAAELAALAAPLVVESEPLLVLEPEPEEESEPLELPEPVEPEVLLLPVVPPLAREGATLAVAALARVLKFAKLREALAAVLVLLVVNSCLW